MATIDRVTVEAISKLGPTGEMAAAELYRRAFDLVAPKDDWKAPIDRLISCDGLQFTPYVVLDAIEFMTATKAIYSREFHSGREYIRFTAAGYRAGPAGP